MSASVWLFRAAGIAVLSFVFVGCGSGRDVAASNIGGAGARAVAGPERPQNALTNEGRHATPPMADHPAWARQTFEPGLPNLARVSDNLYRGGKPSAEGFTALKSMGVKTVVDLGYYFFEMDNLNDRQLRYEHIPFYTWTPTDSGVVRFLRIAASKDGGPVYVHCRKGADRTGFMVAIYRVVVSGWTREQAIAEMTEGGWGFDPNYRNLVSYIRTRDLDGLARQAGIEPAHPADAVSVKAAT